MERARLLLWVCQYFIAALFLAVLGCATYEDTVDGTSVEDDDTGDDDEADDDVGDDDTSDDDTDDGCPWQGPYEGEGAWFEKDPYGDFTMWGFHAWADIDSDCAISGVFDYALVLDGHVEQDGSAQGNITGALSWNPKVFWEWNGAATGTVLEGHWQGHDPQGLYLHGDFYLELAE